MIIGYYQVVRPMQGRKAYADVYDRFGNLKRKTAVYESERKLFKAEPILRKLQWLGFLEVNDG